MAERTDKQRADRSNAVKAHNKRNPGKAAAKLKRWRKKYPEKQREKRLIKKYGITIADFDKMVLVQEGKCDICKLVPIKPLVVDHNHVTNKVRSLLCDKCNQAIGLLKENIDSLQAAIDYLKKHDHVDK